MEQLESRSSEECLTDSLEDIPSSAASLRDLRSNINTSLSASLHDINDTKNTSPTNMTASLRFPPTSLPSDTDCKLTRSASVNLGEMRSKSEGQRRPKVERSMSYVCSGERETPKENKTSRQRRRLSHQSHLKHSPNEPCTCHGSSAEYLTPLQRKDKKIRELNNSIKHLQCTIKEQEVLINKLILVKGSRDNFAEENESIQEDTFDSAKGDSINTTNSSILNTNDNVGCDIKLNGIVNSITHENGAEKMTNTEDAKPSGLFCDMKSNGIESDTKYDGKDINAKSNLAEKEINNANDTKTFYSDYSKPLDSTMGKDDYIVYLTSQLGNLRAKHNALLKTHDATLENLDKLQDSLKALQEEMERKEVLQGEMFLQMFKKGQQSAQFERQDELEMIMVDEPYAVSLHEVQEKLKSTEAKLELWQTQRTTESYQHAIKQLTDAEVTVEFVKASLYHYLTDKSQSAQHLKAIVGILGYSPTQLKALDKLLSQKNNRFNFKSMKASLNLKKS